MVATKPFRLVATRSDETIASATNVFKHQPVAICCSEYCRHNQTHCTQVSHLQIEGLTLSQLRLKKKGLNALSRKRPQLSHTNTADEAQFGLTSSTSSLSLLAMRRAAHESGDSDSWNMSCVIPKRADSSGGQASSHRSSMMTPPPPPPPEPSPPLPEDSVVNAGMPTHHRSRSSSPFSRSPSQFSSYSSWGESGRSSSSPTAPPLQLLGALQRRQGSTRVRPAFPPNQHQHQRTRSDLPPFFFTKVVSEPALNEMEASANIPHLGVRALPAQRGVRKTASVQM